MKNTYNFQTSPHQKLVRLEALFYFFFQISLLTGLLEDN